MLHSFGCDGQPCTNGGTFPGAHPLLAVDGNFYGVTESSGRDCTVTPDGRCGTLYKIVPDGVASQWSVLHRFCKQANCDDGSIPRDGLAADVFGNFYGVTDYGGGGLDMNSHGGGTIFKFDGSLHILHRFCAQANCRDGEYPFTSPIIDSTGNLFGATSYGGAGGEGVIYELTP